MAATRSKSSRARRREPEREVRYTDRRGSVPLDWRFQVRVIREARRLPALLLDDVVEHVDWSRVSGTRTGEINYRRPQEPGGQATIVRGDHVELWAARSQGTRWRRVWRMRALTPTQQIEDGLVAVALVSRLGGHWDGSKVAWKFEEGLRAHEVARRAARRFDVPLGSLAEGHVKLPRKVFKKATVEDVVQWAYRHEHVKSGRRFDIDTSMGFLEVRVLRYPRFALMLGDALMSASMEESLDQLASAVVVTSTRKVKGQRKAKKVRVRVVDAARRRRFGLIERHVEEKGLEDEAAARRFAREWMARVARGDHRVTFTHPGYPWLDRGHALRLNLRPEEGYIVDGWVTEARHTVSGGSYEMEVTMGVGDPYRDVKAAKREKKRERSKRDRDGAGSPDPPKDKRRDRRQ